MKMANFTDLVKIDGIAFEMPPAAEPCNSEISLLVSYFSPFEAPDAALDKLRSFFGKYIDGDKFFVLGPKECIETKKLELVIKLQENRFKSIINLKNVYANAKVEHDIFIIFTFEQLNIHFRDCAIINLAIKDWQNKLTEVLRERGQQNS